jgi:hypothetical protein
MVVKCVVESVLENLFLIVRAISQFFARFEMRDIFARQIDPVSRLGVPADPRWSIMQAKAAKTPDFYSIPIG